MELLRDQDAVQLGRRRAGVPDPALPGLNLAHRAHHVRQVSGIHRVPAPRGHVCPIGALAVQEACSEGAQGHSDQRACQEAAGEGETAETEVSAEVVGRRRRRDPGRPKKIQVAGCDG